MITILDAIQCFKIRNCEHGEIPLTPTVFQSAVLNQLLYSDFHLGPVRLMLHQHRRLGISTICLAVIYALSKYREKKGLIVAPNWKSRFLFRKIIEAFENKPIPKNLKIKTSSEYLGGGCLYHYVYGSCVDHWEHQGERMQEIEQCVPYSKETLIIYDMNEPTHYKHIYL